MKFKFLYIFCAVILIIATCFTTRAYAAQPSASVKVTYITYTVQPGDTLGKIAQKYCTTWQAIYNLNSAAIGPDPNHIHSGMKLTVPANCSGGGTTPPSGGVHDYGPRSHAMGTYSAPYYTVAKGDTLSAIGQRFGIPWQNIYNANHLSSTTIYPGQVLFIPGTSGSTPPPTPVPGSPERVKFATGATSATRTGTISNGAPKSYVLKAFGGQTMYVASKSHGEALRIKILNSAGQALTLSGTNSQVNNSIHAHLPANGDYYVKFTPVTTPESPSLVFDVTFTIP